MPPVSLLIKPASSNCNLRCRYCFYHSIAENRQTGCYGMMSGELLEEIVKKALEYAEHACTFAFQGGEPTLAGLDFYRKLMEFERKYNVKKVQINNALQTNGMAIDDAWAEFLARNRFLVGISLDGPRELHDANRADARGKGSFGRVMEAIGLFNRHSVEYNVLFVVNGYTARHVNKVYGFFRKCGFRYLQMIPCLDPLNEQPGGNEYSLKPDRFTYFLKALFDLWYEDLSKGNMISIRYFDNLVGLLMGYRPEACGMSGECQCQFVVEADGGVYPCDFYVIDEWLLGNIKDCGFDELKNSGPAVRFVEESKPIDPECGVCRWSKLCRGGCRRSREPFVGGAPVLNYYCSSYREFFDYAGERLRRLAAMFSNRRGG